MVCTAVLLFFFFKQKTAYEMRISDWSSDVCSSDLLRRIAELLGRRGNHLDDAGDVVDPGGDRLDAARRLPRHGLPAADLYRDVLRRLDRKSVVSGKSVSVRVDLGGRRFIKTKKKKTQRITTIHTTHQ